MKKLVGTDMPRIIAPVESERVATAAKIAQVVGSANRQSWAGERAEALALLERTLQLRCGDLGLATARAWALKNLASALLARVGSEQRDIYG